MTPGRIQVKGFSSQSSFCIKMQIVLSYSSISRETLVSRVLEHRHFHSFLHPLEMSWPFCGNCGTILDPPVGDEITCDFCGYKCPFQEINTGEIITYSVVRARPAWLGDEEVEESSVQAQTNISSKSTPTSKKASKHATIEEPCPKCGHPELYFYTMQLRSVDEGSTVFYECPKCSHKYSQNN